MKIIVQALLAIALVIAAQAHAAVAYDGSGTAGVTTGGGYATSLNLTTYTCGTGSDRVMYAAVTLKSTSTSPAMTWNSVSLSLISTLAYRSGGDNQYLFRLINPASGNQTLAVTWTGADAGSVTVACFSGADQTTPNGTVATATGTSTTPSSGAVTSGTNDATIAFAALADHSGGLAAFSAGTENQTNIYRGTTTLEANQSVTYAIGGSSNTHNFTSTNHAWGIQALRVLAVSGGGGSIVPHILQQSSLEPANDDTYDQRLVANLGALK